MESALRDFLASKKQSMTHLPRLLSLLDPLNLRAGAIKGKYNTAPKWSDENTTPQQLRAHWRAQCAAITKTKEDALPRRPSPTRCGGSIGPRRWTPRARNRSPGS